VREQPIMARHHRMPLSKAGYTYAVVPTASDRLLAKQEESIYGRSVTIDLIYQGEVVRLLRCLTSDRNVLSRRDDVRRGVFAQNQAGSKAI